MLIITRKEGETVIIDNQIEVTVLSVEGSQVRLGFNAPKSIHIHRKEVYERIQKANIEAAIPKDKIRLPKIGPI